MYQIRNLSFLFRFISVREVCLSTFRFVSYQDVNPINRFAHIRINYDTKVACVDLIFHSTILCVNQFIVISIECHTPWIKICQSYLALVILSLGLTTHKNHTRIWPGLNTITKNLRLNSPKAWTHFFHAAKILFNLT